MEEDREFDSVSKQIDFLFNQLQSLKQKAPSFEAKLEEKITKLQHISKDPTVDALNIQEPVDRCIERYQNQLVKIRRVGKLVETKDETDSGERITSFVNIQKLEELERIKSLEDKLKKEEEKVSDLATNFGNCQSTLLELSAKFDQLASVDLVNRVRDEMDSQLRNAIDQSKMEMLEQIKSRFENFNLEEKVNKERMLTVEEMEKRFDNIKKERNELLKASEVASDNIRLKGTIFAILLGLLVNVSITQRSAEKFWMLITLVSIMLTGTEFIAWGAFKEMLRVDQELKLLMLNEFRWYRDWEEYDNSLPQNMNQLLLLKVNEVRDIHLKWNRKPINDIWGKLKSYFTEPFEIRLVRDISVNTWLILTFCIIFQLMLPVQLIISLHDFAKILSNAPTPASPSPSILQHFLGF